jgi:hypothetical protein
MWIGLWIKEAMEAAMRMNGTGSLHVLRMDDGLMGLQAAAI